MSMGKLIGMGRRSCRLRDRIRRFVSSLLVERHNNRDLRAGNTVDSGACDIFSPLWCLHRRSSDTNCGSRRPSDVLNQFLRVDALAPR